MCAYFGDTSSVCGSAQNAAGVDSSTRRICACIAIVGFRFAAQHAHDTSESMLFEYRLRAVVYAYIMIYMYVGLCMYIHT